jgi:hypothetical protein
MTSSFFFGKIVAQHGYVGDAVLVRRELNTQLRQCTDAPLDLVLPEPGEESFLPCCMIVLRNGTLLDDAANVFAVGFGGGVQVFFDRNQGCRHARPSVMRLYAGVERRLKGLQTISICRDQWWDYCFGRRSMTRKTPLRASENTETGSHPSAAS